MARFKSKLRPNLLQWIKSLQRSTIIDASAIYLPNTQWWELYKRCHPHRTQETHVMSMQQMSYYMSSLALDNAIDGFTRNVIRYPKYKICYKLIKHCRLNVDEDRAVENSRTTPNVLAISPGQSPSKFIIMPSIGINIANFSQ